MLPVLALLCRLCASSASCWGRSLVPLPLPACCCALPMLLSSLMSELSSSRSSLVAWGLLQAACRRWQCQGGREGSC